MRRQRLEETAEATRLLYVDWLGRVSKAPTPSLVASLTEPQQLIGLTRSVAESGISTTTIGFGSGYDEDLLKAMADAGRGSTYYIEKTDQAAVFSRKNSRACCRSRRKTSESASVLAESSDAKEAKVAEITIAAHVPTMSGHLMSFLNHLGFHSRKLIPFWKPWTVATHSRRSSASSKALPVWMCDLRTTNILPGRPEGRTLSFMLGRTCFWSYTRREARRSRSARHFYK